MAITDLQGMRDYIKLMLGMPVINVEIADIQLNQIIEDSVQDFQRYNYDEGSYLDYIVFRLSANQDYYVMSAAVDSRGELINIQDIYDIELNIGIDNINTLFAPSHVLLHDQFLKGNYPGGGGGYGPETTNTGLVMAGYNIAMMYLDEIKNQFGKRYHANWIPGRQVMRVVPTPMTAMYGMLAVYRKEQSQYLYNNPLVKKLCMARSKVLWARHLAKNIITLPDGSSLNYQLIYDEGKTEEQEVMENIKKESQPYDFYIA
jgi:hypothetical protein